MGTITRATVDPDNIPEGTEITQPEPTVADAITESQAENPDAPQELPEEGGEELILGKFKTAEDLQKAYLELERKIGGKTGGVKGLETGSAEEEAAEIPAEVEALDFTKFADELNENGSLSDDSRKAIVAKGIPENIVDAHIAGLAALRQQYTNEVLTIAGGEQSYAAMMKWAISNLSDSERAAYDSAVTSGNMDMAKLAVAGMSARFNQSPYGNRGQLAGRADPTPAIAGFGDMEQVISAQSDPRYATSQAYRNEVEARVAKSDPSIFHARTIR